MSSGRRLPAARQARGRHHSTELLMSLLDWLWKAPKRSIAKVHKGTERRRSRWERARLEFEELERRFAPAVLLNYGGSGTALRLTDSAGGVIVSLHESNSNTLTITLNGFHFA